MNWLGLASVIVLLIAVATTWWSVEGFLAEPISAFRYDGNPLTFIWSSKKGGLELTLKTLAKLSDEGKLPPGVGHRTGLVRLFLYLVTLSVAFSLISSLVGLIFDNPGAFFIAAVSALLAVAFFELSFISAEIPKSFMMTFEGDYWIRWQKGPGELVDMVATALLAASGILIKIQREREVGPRRPPRPRRRARYWW